MIIKKGTHAPFRLPKLLFSPQALRYEVEFTESCRYRFGTEDDADVNKLFGIAFITWGSFWFVIKNLFKGKVKSLHHYNSIRRGWRPDMLSGRIKMIDYGYRNGERFINYSHSIDVGQRYYVSLKKVADLWLLDGVLYKAPNTWLCYELKPYFGGNNPAPHDIKIKMKRL